MEQLPRNLQENVVQGLSRLVEHGDYTLEQALLKAFLLGRRWERCYDEEALKFFTKAYKKISLDI